MLKWNYSLRDLHNILGDFKIRTFSIFEKREVEKRAEKEKIKIEAKPSIYDTTIRKKDGELILDEWMGPLPILLFQQITSFHAKQMEICFNSIGDKITITNYKNIKNFDYDVPEFIRESVKGKPPIIQKISEGIYIEQERGGNIMLPIGSIMSQEDFTKIIRLMKKAGKTFSKAIKEYNTIDLFKEKCIKI